MKPKYTYKFRPTYGLGEMMIEFFELDKDALIKDLLNVLSDNGFTIGKTEDMWMLDEVWTYLSNSKGEIIISNAMYGYVFILISKNSNVIVEIDKVLCNNALFEKEEINFEDYKLKKIHKKPSSDNEIGAGRNLDSGK